MRSESVTLRAWREMPHRRTLAAYLLFTIVSVAGFGSFGLHPELLARYPQLASFYGVAFGFFAQVHVVLGAGILAYFLYRRTGHAWFPAFLAAYALSLTSELLGTSTGFPFGTYSYSALLGWKWLHLVPALIPLSWFAMAVPAFVLADHRFPARTQWPARMLLGAGFLTAWDLALDPAMSWLTPYWSWADAGPYYGMPLINLVGWMGVGALLMVVLDRLMRRRRLRSLSVNWSAAFYGITLLMPLGMVLVAGLWTAVAATVLSVGILFSVAFLGRRPSPKTRRTYSAPVLGPPKDGTPESILALVQARASEVSLSGTESYFQRHSRSFSFAAAWFSPEERTLIAGLYAFCRTTDDFADRGGAVPEVVGDTLAVWQSLVAQAYRDGSSGVAWLDEVMVASRERGVPIALANELVEGTRLDAGRVRMRDWEELDLYMYRVASVVGIWMCHLFGVRSAEAHRRASALGKAMQLTNILRDVGEDLERDRIYLPFDVMSRYGIDDDQLRKMYLSGRVSLPYRALLIEMTGRAEALYAYASEGYLSLPPNVARAVAVAAEVYRGIHAALRRNGYDNLHQRAATTLPNKIILALGGLRRLRRLRIRSSRRSVRRMRPAVGVSGARVALVLVLALLPFQVGRAEAAECPTVEHVRSQYFAAVEDEGVIQPARQLLDACEDPVFRAYDGALLTLRAKHDPWPHRKLRFVREGLGVLDAQVQAAPRDPEIRYLRLMSCYYLPSFFGRSGSVDADFDALAELLPDSAARFPGALFTDMVEFVLAEGDPSDAQRAALKRAVSNPVVQ